MKALKLTIDRAMVCVVRAWYIVFLCAADLCCFPKTIKNAYMSRIVYFEPVSRDLAPLNTQQRTKFVFIHIFF